MRKELEILVYRYKKQKSLDVYSPLTWSQREDLWYQIWNTLGKIDYKAKIKNGEDI